MSTPKDPQPRSSRRSAGLLGKLALSLASLVMMLVFLEIGTRVYIAKFASRQNFAKYATVQQLRARSKPKVIPHRYLGYVTTPSLVEPKNKHNTLGYRGDEIVQPKPPGEFRIACLGGSTTYTLAVPEYQQSYPALLATELAQRGHAKLTVVNAGVPGYSSWETLINLQFRVLDLDPDMLIIYHGVNDIHPRLVWPPSAYRGDNSGRSSPPDVFKKPSLASHSALARVVLIRLGWADSPSAFSNTIDIYPGTYYGDAFMRQKRAGTYPEGIFREVPAMDMLRVNPPVYFRRNIENVIATAQSRGIQVVLATFATSPLFLARPRASSPEYVKAYQEMNDSLRAIAAESAVYLFDFASVFPQDKPYYTDGRHMTAEGAQLKARMFADYLENSDLLPGGGGEPN